MASITARNFFSRARTTSLLSSFTIRTSSSSSYSHFQSRTRNVGTKWAWSAVLGAAAVGATVMFKELYRGRDEETLWPQVLASEEEKKVTPKVSSVEQLCNCTEIEIKYGSISQCGWHVCVIKSSR